MPRGSINQEKANFDVNGLPAATVFTLYFTKRLESNKSSKLTSVDNRIDLGKLDIANIRTIISLIQSILI